MSGEKCVFRKAEFTRFKFARASHVPGMRAQTFHASRVMEVATRFKAKPVEFSTTCMKRLRSHPLHLTRASQLALCKRVLSKHHNAMHKILRHRVCI
jgi:hypothetical protein